MKTRSAAWPSSSSAAASTADRHPGQHPAAAGRNHQPTRLCVGPDHAALPLRYARIQPDCLYRAALLALAHARTSARWTAMKYRWRVMPVSPTGWKLGRSTSPARLRSSRFCPPPSIRSTPMGQRELLLACAHPPRKSRFRLQLRPLVAAHALQAEQPPAGQPHCLHRRIGADYALLLLAARGGRFRLHAASGQRRQLQQPRNQREAGHRGLHAAQGAGGRRLLLARRHTPLQHDPVPVDADDDLHQALAGAHAAGAVRRGRDQHAAHLPLDAGDHQHGYAAHGRARAIACSSTTTPTSAAPPRSTPNPPRSR